MVVRPEDLQISPADNSAENIVSGEVLAAMFMGDSQEVKIRLPGSTLRLKLHPSIELVEGSSIQLALPPDCCQALAG